MPYVRKLKEEVKMSEELSQLPQKLTKFAEYNEQAKKYEKLKEPLNKEIKTIMSGAGIDEFESEGVTATLQTQERSSMNSAKLLNRLKELGFEEAIETVERPNDAVVERLIYDGKLDPELIQDCVETKHVQVLKVKSTVKKKKAL